jgi:hypothetical protein
MCSHARCFSLHIRRVNDPHSLFQSSLYVVTWNVSQKYPDHISLNDLLDIDSDMDKSLPDVYIVGLQEVNANPQNIVTNMFKSDPVSRSTFGASRENSLFAFPQCEGIVRQ